jgi:hypothetical protein
LGGGDSRLRGRKAEASLPNRRREHGGKEEGEGEEEGYEEGLEEEVVIVLTATPASDFSLLGT